MEDLREKLEKTIEKYGVNSEEAYNVSIQLDQEIVNYYKQEKTIHSYQKSKVIYDIWKKKHRSITEQEWNEVAKKKKLLSSQSMKYIGNVSFE